MDRDVYEPRFAQHECYVQRVEKKLAQHPAVSWLDLLSMLGTCLTIVALWMFFALAVLWFCGG